MYWPRLSFIRFARWPSAAFAEAAQDMAAVEEQGDDCKKEADGQEELDRDHIG